MNINISKWKLCGGLLSLVLLGSTSARADWKFKYMEGLSVAKSSNINYGMNPVKSQKFPTTVKVGLGSGGSTKDVYTIHSSTGQYEHISSSYANGYLESGTDSFFLSYRAGGFMEGASAGLKGAHGEMKLTRNGVLEWEGNEPVPEYVWIEEWVQVIASRPYGTPFTFTLKNAFRHRGAARPGDSEYWPVPLPGAPVPGQPTPIPVLNKSMIMPVKTNGQRILHLPSLTLEATIDLAASYGGQNQLPDAMGSMQYWYHVAPVYFDLYGRRKGTEPVTDLTSRFHKIGEDGLESIAAGGKASDEHKMEVMMHVYKKDGLHEFDVKGQSIEYLPILDEGKLKFEGVGQNGNLIVTNEVPGAATTTDANGRIMRGLVTRSRDTVNGPDNVTTLKLKQGVADGPKLPVNQIMAGTFGSGPNGSLPWESNLKVGVPMPIVFKAASAQGVPIKGHNIKFMISRIRLTEVDEVTKQLVERLYTSDLSEVNQTSGPSVIYKSVEDLEDYISEGISISENTVPEGGDGLYKSSMTILPPDKFITHELSIVAQDSDVYQIP